MRGWIWGSVVFLLRVAPLPPLHTHADGSRELEHFNVNYMAAWKETHNFKMWQSKEHSGMESISCGHPFAGQLSVSDMKLRFAHTMQNTESGRKLNQAMASTGRVVATTSKAVGGAISHAKGAFSNWWSNLLVSPDVQKGMEATNENIGEVIKIGETEMCNSEADIKSSDDIPDSINMHVANGSVIRESREEEGKRMSSDSSIVQNKKHLDETSIEKENRVVDINAHECNKVHTV